MSPDDPSAVFVEWVPRENWGQLKLETAADFGFIKVDQQGERILYEGDRKRFVVPKGALLACSPEEESSATGGNRLIVIKGHHPDTAWEAPVTLRGQFNRGRNARLLEAIQSLL